MPLTAFHRVRTRARRVVKWAGPVLTILLVVAWLGSQTRRVAWSPTGRYWISLAGGHVRFARLEPAAPANSGSRRWESGPISPEFSWWFQRGSIASYSSWSAVPVWVFIVPTAGATAAAWWLDARARRRPGLCPRCGYDLAGLSPGTPCPECGRVPARPRVAPE